MPRNILCLSPHTDDVELGVGGTICRLAEEEDRVYYVALSDAKKSVPEGLNSIMLTAGECRKATKILGVHSLKIMDYPTRKFPLHRQDILDDFLHLKKTIDPSIVFIPCSSDIHQDHQVVYQEGLRAFRDVTLYGYELPWNNFEFKAQAFFVLTKEQVVKKQRAFDCYKSQHTKRYYSKDVLIRWATLRGVLIGEPYAECFEVIREIL